MSFRPRPKAWKFSRLRDVCEFGKSRRVMESLVYCLIFFLITVVSVVSAKPVESDTASLYDENDNVTELYGSTFNKTVYNSPHIWMVEFYSSWCGDCQSFAPIFKAFAKDIADWHGVYQLAVINCPDNANRDFCLSNDVKGFPEMRVFAPFSTPGSQFTYVKDKEVKTLRSTSVKLIDQYIDEVAWSLNGKLKPTFARISFKEVESFHKNDRTSYYLALIVGNDPRDIGREVILDLSSSRNITVRRFDNDPDEIKKLAKFSGISVDDFPTVIVLSKGGSWQEIKVDFKRRHFYTYKLQRLPGIGNSQLIPKSNRSHVRHKTSDINWKNIDRSKVYLADLESGLHYALLVEVASVKALKGETLNALRRFIGILHQVSEQFPMRDSTRNFFSELTGWLVGQSEISRNDWLSRIQIKEEDSFLPQLDQRWVGCAPSKPGLRGYPCSLWTLFHSLSVAAYNADIEDVMAVPRAMEAYITNFFTCMECRKNFVRELKKYPYIDRVFTHKDAILWLWDLHNEVNRRLHGEISEDPNIHKVQYPSKELCPKCMDSEGSWNRDRVFHHLIQRYNIASVSKDFMKSSSSLKSVADYDFDIDGNFLGNSMKIEDTLLVDMLGRNVDASNWNGNPKLLVGNQQKQDSLQQRISSKRLSKRLMEQHNNWVHPTADLTYFDTSLCIVLWLASLAVVAMMYLYLKRRKTFKNC